MQLTCGFVADDICFDLKEWLEVQIFFGLKWRGHLFLLILIEEETCFYWPFVRKWDVCQLMSKHKFINWNHFYISHNRFICKVNCISTCIHFNRIVHLIIQSNPNSNFVNSIIVNDFVYFLLFFLFKCWSNYLSLHLGLS